MSLVTPIEIEVTRTAHSGRFDLTAKTRHIEPEELTFRLHRVDDQWWTLTVGLGSSIQFRAATELTAIRRAEKEIRRRIDKYEREVR